MSQHRLNLFIQPEHARRLDELAILAPGDDRANADDLARLTGARLVPLHGPLDAAGAVQRALA